MAVLQEWLDKNAHRQYPLADDATGKDITGNFLLPTSLIVDLLINTPLDVAVADFYLSKVLIRKYSIYLEIKYNNDVVGSFEIPTNQGVNSSYDMSANPELSNTLYRDMTGTIIIGRVDEAIANPGEWEFDKTGGAIIPTAISKGLAGLRQVIVGENVFNDKLILQEGDNVELEVSSSGGEHIVTIKAAAPADTAEYLRSDADIMNYLISTYGQPLTHINNIPPDALGNFTFTGIDCTEIFTDDGQITINNPCAKPCCDKSYLDNVYDQINTLNINAGRLSSFFEELSTLINAMQNKLGLLQLDIKQD